MLDSKVTLTTEFHTGKWRNNMQDLIDRLEICQGKIQHLLVRL